MKSDNLIKQLSFCCEFAIAITCWTADLG